MPDTGTSVPTKTTPLEGLPAPFGGVSLEERPFVGKVTVRGNPDDDAFVAAAEEVVKCALPIEPNTVTEGPGCTIFWLGPNEWQIHCSKDHQTTLATELREALKGVHAAVVDVSDYYVVMRLSGDKTLEVLGKGTPLDLHPRSFPPGRCAQTRFGHATVLMHKVKDDVVDVQVRWSFAEYVWLYLIEGTREYR